MSAMMIGSIPGPLEIALPALTAVLTATVLLLFALLRRGGEEDQTFTLLLGLGGCVVTFLALLQLAGRPGVAFRGELRIDDFGLWTSMLATLATLLTMLGILGHLQRYGAGWSEALSLMMLGLSGLILVCLVVFLVLYRVLAGRRAFDKPGKLWYPE